MKRFEIFPRAGIGPIKFGASRAAVREALSAEEFVFEESRGSQDYFSKATIQVEYEDDGTASFIGISNYDGLSLLFQGVDLFDVEASAVFDLLAQTDGSGEHAFSPFEYVFPNQILTLYEADTQYDRRRAESRAVWGQIGAGDARYLDAILKIQGGQLNRPPSKRK